MGKLSKYGLGIFPLMDVSIASRWLDLMWAHPNHGTSRNRPRQAVKSSLQDSIFQLRNLGLQSMFKWFNHHVKSQSVVLVSLQGEASQI